MGKCDKLLACGMLGDSTFLQVCRATVSMLESPLCPGVHCIPSLSARMSLPTHTHTRKIVVVAVVAVAAAGTINSSSGASGGGGGDGGSSRICCCCFTRYRYVVKQW